MVEQFNINLMVFGKAGFLLEDKYLCNMTPIYNMASFNDMSLVQFKADGKTTASPDFSAE